MRCFNTVITKKKKKTHTHTLHNTREANPRELLTCDWDLGAIEDNFRSEKHENIFL